MQKRVAILSEHSLFAEGVASRLKEYPHRIEYQFINPRRPDFLEELTSLQPTAVILDDSDDKKEPHCVICGLLQALPAIRIIRLAVHEDTIQVVDSEQQVLSEVRDLVDVIEQTP